MELILWRHAEAENSQPDMQRALTAKGLEQAEKMAAWLKPRLPADTRILVSPATRAQQTASALGLQFTTLDTLAPGTGVQSLLQETGWPKAGGAVLIVGHQPTLGMTAAFAMTNRTSYWSVKKAAIWWISRRTRGEEQQTLLRTVITPEQL